VLFVSTLCAVAVAGSALVLTLDLTLGCLPCLAEGLDALSFLFVSAKIIAALPSVDANLTDDI
jgi:hypothetical protein